MSYRNIRDTREGFVDMGAGDKLIKIESRILAIAAFILMITYFKTGIIPALIAGAIVGFVFPWLVGLVEFFAWIVTIAFSIIWAVIGYFIVGAICGDSPVAGLIGAIIIFIISFFMHKTFAGLGISSITKHALDSWDHTGANTAQINQTLNRESTSSARFCVKCGAQLKDNAAFCSKCGTPQ